MEIIRWMFQRFRIALLLVLVLSTLNAAVAVLVIAFINEHILQNPAVTQTGVGTSSDSASPKESWCDTLWLVAKKLGLEPEQGVPVCHTLTASLQTFAELIPANTQEATAVQFVGLLVLMFGMGTVASLTMTTLGHRLVYQLRCHLVKRVLDTDMERLEALGPARILASLNHDTGQITTAFISLPSAIYGIAMTLGGFAYLAWLSAPLFYAIAAWLGITVLAGGLLLKRTHERIFQAREIEDKLYEDYQAVIEGRKELALNRWRAWQLYKKEFEPHANAGRDHETYADVYNGLNENWVNTMILGAIGLSFFLAQSLAWTDTSTAATFALTILFLRTPLTAVVTAIPGLLGGGVALSKLKSLELAAYKPHFDQVKTDLPQDWQCLHLNAVSYCYAQRDGDKGFDLEPIDLRLKRGETVFLIGGNGSGKSTLARLLTGLYRPQGGQIWVDGIAVDESSRAAFRQMFATVFSDFYLFQQILKSQDAAVDEVEIQRWIDILALRGKAKIAHRRIQDTRLSQGQRKRLALLVALMEDRPILVLDEWAADQDPHFRQVFYTQILPELKSAGKTIFAISHDEHYFHLADRLLKLNEGQIQELMPPGNVATFTRTCVPATAKAAS